MKLVIKRELCFKGGLHEWYSVGNTGGYWPSAHRCKKCRTLTSRPPKT
jgi:hypothetical protein